MVTDKQRPVKVVPYDEIPRAVTPHFEPTAISIINFFNNRIGNRSKQTILGIIEAEIDNFVDVFEPRSKKMRIMRASAEQINILKGTKLMHSCLIDIRISDEKAVKKTGSCIGKSKNKIDDICEGIAGCPDRNSFAYNYMVLHNGSKINAITSEEKEIRDKCKEKADLIVTKVDEYIKQYTDCTFTKEDEALILSIFLRMRFQKEENKVENLTYYFKGAGVKGEAIFKVTVPEAQLVDVPNEKPEDRVHNEQTKDLIKTQNNIKDTEHQKKELERMIREKEKEIKELRDKSLF
jgi:hypothetical protein